MTASNEPKHCKGCGIPWTFDGMYCIKCKLKMKNELLSRAKTLLESLLRHEEEIGFTESIRKLIDEMKEVGV